MRTKKGQLIGAMNQLPAAVMSFVVFAIMVIVGLKIVSGLMSTITTPAAGVSAIDNNTYNNMTLVLNSISNFTTNSGLIAIIVVMSVVLSVVIAAFSFRRGGY